MQHKNTSKYHLNYSMHTELTGKTARTLILDINAII